MMEEVSEYDFTVYERISGAWVKNLQMLERHALLNIDRSKDVLVKGDYKDNTYYKDGVIMECGEKPHYWAKWSNQKEGWVDWRTDEQIDAKVQIMKEENKAIRNRLLLESDWTVGQDSPLTPEKMAEWVVYRQKLRDIVQWVNTVFPEPPSK